MKNPLVPSTRTLGRYIGLAALLLAGPDTPVRAADAPATALSPATTPAPEKRSRFRFTLLPKSIQRRPSLDFHVISELTAEGKKLALPSPAQPIYYIAQPGVFTKLGSTTEGTDAPPNPERLLRAIESALASGQYLKASPTTPLPAIAVVFNYGSFARFSMEQYDREEEEMLAEATEDVTGPMSRSEERGIDTLLAIVTSHRAESDEVLKRATLVGGEKFSHELAKALDAEAKFRSGGSVGSLLGISGIAQASPFHIFLNANEDTMRLVEDSFNGCYYVIASAFDYTAMKKGQRVLLWRTKMTVNSSGISLAESLPPLVQAAGPYLGRDMPDAVTLTRKIIRDGNVKMGDVQFLETGVPAPGKSAPDQKPAPAPTPPPDPAAKP